MDGLAECVGHGVEEIMKLFVVGGNDVALVEHLAVPVHHTKFCVGPPDVDANREFFHIERIFASLSDS